MPADPNNRLAAYAVLGLDPGARPEALIGAFRDAAKRCHPDRPGGDAESFRRVLEAYRLLQSQPQLPAPTDLPPFMSPAFAPYVEVSPLVALRGGECEAVLAGGRRRTVRIPPGVRHGETVSVAGVSVSVRFLGDGVLQARGSDLWLTVPVPASLLGEGGRVTVETPLGPKVLWISRRVAQRRLIRLEGQGLPARGGHPRGHLFLRLAPDPAEPESAARVQLKKFAAAWAA
ncbi:MAG TPA: DnaJ C-terminal domain-containing protein [Caulobacteraceae bacterium]|nr:DnaJ C-terminal domain-containing protein [Caulobacteraceae bacterium]